MEIFSVRSLGNSILSALRQHLFPCVKMGPSTFFLHQAKLDSLTALYLLKYLQLFPSKLAFDILSFIALSAALYKLLAPMEKPFIWGRILRKYVCYPMVSIAERQHKKSDRRRLWH